MKNERGVRSRGRLLPKEGSDVEGREFGSQSTPENATNGTATRRGKRRSRKKPAVARFFKRVFKAKLRRYGHLVRQNPQGTMRTVVWMGITTILSFLLLIVHFYLKVESIDLTEDHFQVVGDLSAPIAVKFSFTPATEAFSLPYGNISKIESENEKEWDYGDLYMDFFEDDESHRQIYHDFTMDEMEYRLPDASRDDDLEGYYLFDDDKLRSDYINTEESCRRIPEHRINYQNCNTYHEQDFLEHGITYLGAGSYRQVFAIGHPFKQEIEMVAVKDIHFSMDVETDNFEFVRMDAMIAERLSSSPRTFNIYGYCGLGIMSEFFIHGDIGRVVIGGNGLAEQDYDRGELKPQNHLTGKEKLVLALEMAEGIAVLHGYSGGIIVHDDIKLSQYLLNRDKKMLKINDFNRAEFMLFDETSQEYCRYKNGVGHGRWRSPEEYEDNRLNEKIDIWSLGNNMYSLLTGLSPFYWLKTEIAKTFLAKGEVTYIDPRYFNRSKEEKALAELIEKCFRLSPDDRPTIFEVVSLLREAVSESLEKDETKAGILQHLLN